jgi:hypothetical protein
MEKQIEKILEKYGIDTYHWKPEIAKEIASLYEGWYPGEFVKWCLFEPNNKYYVGEATIRTMDGKDVTLPDLFNYWYKEIYKK